MVKVLNEIMDYKNIYTILYDYLIKIYLSSKVISL